MKVWDKLIGVIVWQPDSKIFSELHTWDNSHLAVVSSVGRRLDIARQLFSAVHWDLCCGRVSLDRSTVLHFVVSGSVTWLH